MNTLVINRKIWITSDSHFGHDNIIKFGQRTKAHEVTMLANWIDRIREEDTILHLGDVAMGGPMKQVSWLKVIGRLPGKKYLVLGNHDELHHEQPYHYTDTAGFTVIPEFEQDGVVFSHRPVCHGDLREFSEWEINVHGHTHANAFNPTHDGFPFEDKRYVNVCVEHTNMGPVQIGNLLPEVKWTLPAHLKCKLCNRELNGYKSYVKDRGICRYCDGTAE